ncbi:hypothetical protein K402DRAFT_440874 [Aulographum hederae CBS 113979]|uniref:Uncharacterized protein n=1 Tax=Aulographum hederae CBS 113979 TaxID=1176131 RepID=A0A6G1GJR9_9PEZI|nr:hypothetical protein K402DRAFT_440874 [Aulographum hederae CBS 113979]
MSRYHFLSYVQHVSEKKVEMDLSVLHIHMLLDFLVLFLSEVLQLEKFWYLFPKVSSLQIGTFSSGPIIEISSFSVDGSRKLPALLRLGVLGVGRFGTRWTEQVTSRVVPEEERSRRQPYFSTPRRQQMRHGDIGIVQASGDGDASNERFWPSTSPAACCIAFCRPYPLTAEMIHGAHLVPASEPRQALRERAYTYTYCSSSQTKDGGSPGVCYRTGQDRMRMLGARQSSLPYTQRADVTRLHPLYGHLSASLVGTRQGHTLTATGFTAFADSVGLGRVLTLLEVVWWTGGSLGLWQAATSTSFACSKPEGRQIRSRSFTASPAFWPHTAGVVALAALVFFHSILAPANPVAGGPIVLPPRDRIPLVCHPLANHHLHCGVPSPTTRDTQHTLRYLYLAQPPQP